MKRALVSVLRLTALVGVLVLLPHINRELNAQTGTSSCQTFTAPTDQPCPSCCTLPGGSVPDVPFSTGSGKQSLQATAWSCGTQPATCAYACSGTTYTAVDDGSCCIPHGSACTAGAKPCCDSGDTCTNGVCAPPPPPPPNPACSWPCKPGYKRDPVTCQCKLFNSPIIIDLNGGGFHLTSAENGVSFDISGTGIPIQMAWTASGTDNAFLALPGADSLVHDGKQLFGNFTPQPASDNPNGFIALAVYDDPKNAGNGDGIIDSRDAIFASLRLWIDANHDGISQPDELHTLPSLGVNSISLKYKESKKTDQYGNVFRYRARVNGNESQDVGQTAYDVFFVTPAPTL